MIDIQKIAREAGFFLSTELKDNPQVAKYERFAALIREAVVQELVAGSGESDGYRIGKDGEREDVYTADQLAGAVARERERCAQKVEAEAVCDNAAYYAAAIRSGE